MHSYDTICSDSNGYPKQGTGCLAVFLSLYHTFLGCSKIKFCKREFVVRTGVSQPIVSPHPGQNPLADYQHNRAWANNDPLMGVTEFVLVVLFLIAVLIPYDL